MNLTVAQRTLSTDLVKAKAVLLSCTGGFIGVLSGLAVSALNGKFSPFPSIIQWSGVMLAFGFAVITEVSFGFYPAKRASELEPIEALRYE